MTFHNEKQSNIIVQGDNTLPRCLGSMMWNVGAKMPQQANCDRAGEALVAVLALRHFGLVRVQFNSVNTPIKGAAKVSQYYTQYQPRMQKHPA